MLNKRTFLAGIALAALSACGRRIKPYYGPQVTRLVIYKEKRRLYILHGAEVIKEYKIGLGGNPVGAKQFVGDGKTPEGSYFIDRRNPNSAYHLSIGISYPNKEDVARAAALGQNPGGDIFIHGQANKHLGLGNDWTAGCIAVTDAEIEEIYAMVPLGVQIDIWP
ncbi:L,D-transpeptidase catalytic domain [Aquimixticola soesokkakensis]|uniref:L,D-transpeptidase catalytic domain n=1 Tax=Aquimixticola soesokkakensis TaxID=1519096 RepID=A0A1Y5R7S2_9RHOB|nr:L,D-transpeptidase family protein [Aquimixticola soesokkakensis]SLN11137.1 L,D-transpeptidase catalytic domain [Aquimixticola soesokkakensis]